MLQHLSNIVIDYRGQHGKGITINNTTDWCQLKTKNSCNAQKCICKHFEKVKTIKHLQNQ